MTEGIKIFRIIICVLLALTIEANNGASVFAVSDKKDSDIFCSGAVINCGALVDAKVDVLGGIHKKSEN